MRAAVDVAGHMARAIQCAAWPNPVGGELQVPLVVLQAERYPGACLLVCLNADERPALLPRGHAVCEPRRFGYARIGIERVVVEPRDDADLDLVRAQRP